VQPEEDDSAHCKERGPALMRGLSPAAPRVYQEEGMGGEGQWQGETGGLLAGSPEPPAPLPWLTPSPALSGCWSRPGKSGGRRDRSRGGRAARQGPGVGRRGARGGGLGADAWHHRGAAATVGSGLASVVQGSGPGGAVDWS